jgi:hypothetical protein
MELAIPLVAIGGMYVLSNQDKKQKVNNRENYRNIQSPTNKRLERNRENILKNRKQVGNFPINGHSQIKDQTNYYSNPNAPVDKFFHFNKQVKKHEETPGMYKSLSGNTVSASSFNHNNMVPFFGSKLNPTNDFKNNENRLDNMIGNGSQQIRKQEQAPLFKPQENMQWGHGTPNTSDFIQSRINPSMSMANVKPFQEVRVGPGLNEKGGVLGSGGFNSGMEMREKWMPKTVDDLRVENNKKQTYGGVILGGKTTNTNRGIQGKIEKRRPDTYYENTQDRYFVTTGIQKAQTARSNMIMKDEHRSSTTKEYYGNGNDNSKATYVNGKYNEPKRVVLEADIKHISNPKALNDNPNGRQIQIQSFKNSATTNNRSIDQQRETHMGPMKALQQALIAPILDTLRPSRKENFVGNLRKSGNIAAVDAGAGYVYNPADKTKTTIRETTENSKGHRFVNSQKEAGGYGYLVNKQQSFSQNRDTTTTDYAGGVYNGDGNAYEVTDHYAPLQQRDTTNTHYIGNSGNTSGTSKSMTYDSAYNAQMIDKEPIMRGRTPMGSNVKMFNAEQNVRVVRQDEDRVNNRSYAPKMANGLTPSLNNFGAVRMNNGIGQNIYSQRNNPENLRAFQNNPYTKPLDSVA